MLKYIGILELVYLFSLYSVGICDITKIQVVVINITIRFNVTREIVNINVTEVRRAPPVGNHIHTDVADATIRVSEIRIGVAVIAAVRRAPVGTAVDVVDDVVVEATGRDDTKSNTVPIRDRRAKFEIFIGVNAIP